MSSKTDLLRSQAIQNQRNCFSGRFPLPFNVETLQAFEALFQIPHYYRKCLYSSERVTSTRRDSSLRGRLPRYRLLLVLQLLHACSIAFLRNDSGAPLRAVSLIAATDNSCLLCALGTQVPLHICLGWMATEWRARPCTSQTGSSVAIHRVIGRFGEFRSIEPSLLYDVSLS
jgi:hypothetical protein